MSLTAEEPSKPSTSPRERWCCSEFDAQGDADDWRQDPDLAYNTEPGIALSEAARLTFYGRLGYWPGTWIASASSPAKTVIASPSAAPSAVTPAAGVSAASGARPQ